MERQLLVERERLMATPTVPMPRINALTQIHLVASPRTLAIFT